MSGSQRFFINGSPVSPNDVVGTITTTISVQDENLLQQSSITSDIKFYGTAFQTVKSLLIDPINPQINTVHIRVYDMCCDDFLPYDFILNATDVKFCLGDCFCTVSMKIDNPDERILKQIREKSVYDNSTGLFSDASRIPQFPYCVEHRHNFITHAIIALSLYIILFATSLLAPLLAAIATITLLLAGLCAVVIAVLAIVQLVLIIVRTIVQVINAILRLLLLRRWQINIGNLQINIIPPACQQLFQNPLFIGQELLDLYKLIIDFIINCDDKHPAPYVRDYIQNISTVCGASGWQSSFAYSNPSAEYYHACYLYAPIDNGANNPPAFIDKNKVDKVSSLFLDDICKPINHRWWVHNGILYVEQRSFLLNQPIYFDCVSERSDIVEDFCFDYSPETPYAGLLVKYAEDAREEIGNEQLDEYQADVSYSNYYGNNQGWEKRKEVYVPFAAVRTRNDELRPLIRYNALSWWQQFGFVNTLLGNRLSATHDYLMMQRGTTTVPKLLIKEPSSPHNMARVKDYGPGQHINYAFKLKPGANITQPNGSAWDSFIELDPTLTPYKRYRFSGKIRFTCQRMAAAQVYKQILFEPGKIGRIESFTFDLNERTIIISGTI